jgi:hypothetical protein
VLNASVYRVPRSTALGKQKHRTQWHVGLVHVYRVPRSTALGKQKHGSPLWQTGGPWLTFTECLRSHSVKVSIISCKTKMKNANLILKCTKLSHELFHVIYLLSKKFQVQIIMLNFTLNRNPTRHCECLASLWKMYRFGSDECKNTSETLWKFFYNIDVCFNVNSSNLMIYRVRF